MMEVFGTPAKLHCTVQRCNWTAIREDFKRDKRKSIILVHGGTHFGDTWLHEHKYHMEIVKMFSDYPIVFLPQTVRFKSKKLLWATQKAFENHSNLTLLARDRRSLLELRENFGQHSTEFCPDSTFMIGPVASTQCIPDVDILIIAREDGEESAASGSIHSALQMLDDKNLTYIIDDWPFGKFTLPKNPLVHDKFRFEVGCKCLCKGRLVITDRLQATILSMLMGKPHVYLDDSYGKVRSFRASHFKRRPECDDSHFGSNGAVDWKSAMAKAIKLLAT